MGDEQHRQVAPFLDRGQQRQHLRADRQPLSLNTYATAIPRRRIRAPAGHPLQRSAQRVDHLADLDLLDDQWLCRRLAL